MNKLETLRRNLANMSVRRNAELNIYTFTSGRTGDKYYIIYESEEDLKNQLEMYNRKESESQRLADWGDPKKSVKVGPIEWIRCVLSPFEAIKAAFTK